MPETYCIAKIDGDGHATRLTPWQSFDDCDALIDALQDQYASAIVDIFTPDECPDL